MIVIMYNVAVLLCAPACLTVCALQVILFILVQQLWVNLKKYHGAVILERCFGFIKIIITVFMLIKRKI